MSSYKSSASFAPYPSAHGRLAQAVVQPGSAAFAREDYLYDAHGNRIAVERRTAANDTIAAQTDSYTLAPARTALPASPARLARGLHKRQSPQPTQRSGAPFTG